MLFVGSLSSSIGCTIKKRTPSRSGDFFVDQTVPTTLPKNIWLRSAPRSSSGCQPLCRQPCEHFVQRLSETGIIRLLQNDSDEQVVGISLRVVAQQRPQEG